MKNSSIWVDDQSNDIAAVASNNLMLPATVSFAIIGIYMTVNIQCDQQIVSNSYNFDQIKEVPFFINLGLKKKSASSTSQSVTSLNPGKRFKNLEASEVKQMMNFISNFANYLSDCFSWVVVVIIQF